MQHSDWAACVQGLGRLAAGRLLCTASADGAVRIVKGLLAAGVPANANNNEPIYVASRNGHVDVVRLLLADARVWPDDNDKAALLGACSAGHTEVVQLLLSDHRVRPCWISVIRAMDKPEVLRLLIADGRAGTLGALRCATRYGETESLRRLLTDRRARLHQTIDSSRGSAHRYVKEVREGYEGSVYEYGMLCQTVVFGHLNAARLLLTDDRVTVTPLVVRVAQAAKQPAVARFLARPSGWFAAPGEQE